MEALKELSKQYGGMKVFTDFLDFCIAVGEWKTQDQMQMFSHYSPQIPVIKAFRKAFEQLAIDSESNGVGYIDAIGDYFMTNFGKKGQSFTPNSLVKAMTEIMQIKYQQPGTVYDYACGSGRTLLGAAKENRTQSFHGTDIDLNCCKMTAINLLLNGLNGEVVWGNALSMERKKTFVITKLRAVPKIVIL